jgi:hypothetical protein
VRFAADVTILTPCEPERGNRRLLLDVPNRGNRLAMRFLNSAPPAVPGTPIDPGDGFLMRQGYTVAWCGWQHDVPDVPGLMRAFVPEATAADGGPVRGPIMVSFQPTRPARFNYFQTGRTAHTRLRISWKRTRHCWSAKRMTRHRR